MRIRLRTLGKEGGRRVIECRKNVSSEEIERPSIGRESIIDNDGQYEAGRSCCLYFVRYLRLMGGRSTASVASDPIGCKETKNTEQMTR